MSDHGLPHCYADPCSERQAAAIFDKARSGTPASSDEQRQFASFLMLFFGHLDAARGWIKQLHLGALRSVNTRRVAELGADTGFDNIGDWPQARALCGYLDLLERETALPRICWNEVRMSTVAPVRVKIEHEAYIPVPKQQIIGDDEASKLLSLPMRAPWHL